jgi:hypothetical protein
MVGSQHRRAQGRHRFDRRRPLAAAALAMASLLPWPLGGAALAAGAEPRTEVDVVVDMTPQGRKVAPPSPGHPVYYLPVMGGFQELGTVVAGAPPPPPPVAVAKAVAQALASQGYRVVDAAHRQAALVLAIHWGSLNPQIEKDPVTGDRVFFNQHQMLAMTGGNTLGNLDLNFEREAVLQGAERDRYFIAITAYDFEAYHQRHKKVLLWQAKMSVPSERLALGDVLTVLVRAGAPLFGRETVRPKMLILPVTPEGRVEIGVPTVKDYQDAPTRAPASPPAAGK